MQFTVTVCHDQNEGIWFVQASEVPGLNAEASSFDGLLEVIVDVVPDLLAANLPEARFEGAATIPLCIQHVVTARRAHAA
jgi:hypothetical protein